MCDGSLVSSIPRVPSYGSSDDTIKSLSMKLSLIFDEVSTTTI